MLGPKPREGGTDDFKLMRGEVRIEMAEQRPPKPPIRRDASPLRSIVPGYLLLGIEGELDPTPIFQVQSARFSSREQVYRNRRLSKLGCLSRARIVGVGKDPKQTQGASIARRENQPAPVGPRRTTSFHPALLGVADTAAPCSSSPS